jgi:hypothetical protein
MLRVVLGHVFGIGLGIVLLIMKAPFWNRAENFWSLVLGLVLILGFFEYQALASIKSGTLFSKEGWIHESKSPRNFKQTQFMYAFLAGFMSFLILSHMIKS